ncbi:MAG: preprotein translocase subunit SecE [Acidobacteriota bacterium]|nr:preprotein translocase subunit SecE [Acidobacteriota bacterium]
MATHAVKVKNEESHSSKGAELGHKVTGTIDDTKEFLHDVRIEMRQVTWPSREDVISTTGVVIATVFFFGVFLWIVDLAVQRGVAYVFKAFGV